MSIIDFDHDKFNKAEKHDVYFLGYFYTRDIMEYERYEKVLDVFFTYV